MKIILWALTVFAIAIIKSTGVLSPLMFNAMLVVLLVVLIALIVKRDANKK